MSQTNQSPQNLANTQNQTKSNTAGSSSSSTSTTNKKSDKDKSLWDKAFNRLKNVKPKDMQKAFGAVQKYTDKK